MGTQPPFDARLLIEAAELFVAELSMVEEVVRLLPLHNLPIPCWSGNDLLALQRRGRRIRAILCDGDVEVLLCREHTLSYVRELARELIPAAEAASELNPGQQWAEIIDKAACDRAMACCNLIRECEGIQFVSPEEESADVARRATDIAWNAGYHGTSQLLTVLEECERYGITPPIYGQLVVKTGTFPLSAIPAAASTNLDEVDTPNDSDSAAKSPSAPIKRKDQPTEQEIEGARRLCAMQPNASKDRFRMYCGVGSNKAQVLMEKMRSEGRLQTKARTRKSKT